MLFLLSIVFVLVFLELHGQRDLKDQDLALSLLHGACITILQHTAILVCLKSSTIQERTVRIVSGLFMKIIKGAYLESNIALCKYFPVQFVFEVVDCLLIVDCLLLLWRLKTIYFPRFP